MSIMKKSMVLLLLISIVLVSCETDDIQILTENEVLYQERANEGELGCETAFAYYKEGCFIEDGFSEWGWVIGPLKEGFEGEFDMYQGADQCDISKGQHRGSVTIKYSKKGSLEVIYKAISGYAFFETQIYVGNEKYPALNNDKPIVDPSEYTEQHWYSGGEFKDYYKIDNMSGDLYVIAHAAICMNGNR